MGNKATRYNFDSLSSAPKGCLEKDSYQQKSSLNIDLPYVKTGISSAAPPAFLTSPLLVKTKSKEKNPLDHFIRGIHWKPKEVRQQEKVSEKTHLKLIINTDDPINLSDVKHYPKLAVHRDEEIKEEIKQPVEIEEIKEEITQEPSSPEEKPTLLTNEDFKSLLATLALSLKALKQSQKPVQHITYKITSPPAQKKRTSVEPLTQPVAMMPICQPVEQFIPTKPHPTAVTVIVAPKRFQKFLKELNKIMSKLSITGLIFGLLLLGLLFFFVGFLASYSSMKGQLPACHDQPVIATDDTVIEDQVTKKTTKSTDPFEKATQSLENKVVSALKLKGPAADIAKSYMDDKIHQIQNTQKATNSMTKRKLSTLGKASQQEIINQLPPGIRPFAQQSYQLHHPGKVYLSPQASALQGPFTQKRFGTTPPPLTRDRYYHERGMGPGTLRDAYQKQYTQSDGIRPHVPKPVFAPSAPTAPAPWVHPYPQNQQQMPQMYVPVIQPQQMQQNPQILPQSSYVPSRLIGMG